VSIKRPVTRAGEYADIRETKGGSGVGGIGNCDFRLGASTVAVLEDAFDLLLASLPLVPNCRGSGTASTSVLYGGLGIFSGCARCSASPIVSSSCFSTRYDVG
jgi:hypothetical protein